jgi:PAS domain S-box-containing protein
MKMGEKLSYEDLDKRIKELEEIVNKKEQRSRMLQANLDLYRLLIEDVDVGLTTINKDFNIIYANSIICEWMETTLDKLKGKKCYEKYEKRNTVCRDCPVTKTIATSKNKEAETANIKPNGTSFIVRDRAGNVIAFNELVENITKFKQAEQALKDNEEKYLGIISNLMEGFYSVTLDGTLLEYNKGFKKILGLNFNKGASGLKLSNFWQDPADRNLYLEELFKNGFIKNYELKAKKLDGTVIVVQTNSRLVYDKQKKPLRIEGSFIDITKRKQVEKALNKAFDEMESKVEQRTTELKELNSALTILLKRSDKDKTELENKILSNVKVLIMPIIKKLEKSLLDNNQSSLLSTIETDLNNIISPFSQVLSSKYSILTSKEIQIAKLIREGKTSKEIAELTSSQKSTIEFHRKNLRKKLGLKKKSENLKYHLLSI